jgi:alpha-ketoglutarate-dependent taurine dioxygenase
MLDARHDTEALLRCLLDIVYWNNQAVLHARSAFDPSSRRVLKRISLAGSRPF